MDDDDLDRPRKDIDWVPYHKRRSTGSLRYKDDGEKVTVYMEVASLGVLVLAVIGKYSSVLQQIKWDQSAQMTGRIL